MSDSRRTILARVVLLAIVVGSATPRSLHSQRASQPIRPGADSVTITTTEGTSLGFDLTPDGRTIVVDLLGQLWTLPVEGGRAVPLTDAVHDGAEDAEPNVSPDGRWIVFRSDRPQGRGLWLRSLTDGTLRQLTDSNYFPNYEHVAPTWSADGRRVAYAARWQLHVRDIVSGRDTVLQPAGLPRLAQPSSWSRDGSRLLIMASNGFPPRLYEIYLNAGRVVALDTLSYSVQAPSYSPDGSRIAYFAQRDDSSDVGQLLVRSRNEPNARAIAESREWVTFPIDARVRWSPDGRWLYYSGDGKLWRVSPDGGTPTTIPFSATLTIPRVRAPRPTVALPAPGSMIAARGFTGLAIAPDARSFAVLALGRLWVAGIGGRPRAVTTVPFTATGLSWSPDGREVVWSAGRGGAQDLHVTTIAGGATRRLTALRGSETQAAWSPDGEWISFVHWARPELPTPPWAGDTIGRRIRIVRARLAVPATLADTRELGRYEADPYTSGDLRPVWNDSSTAVLAFQAGWMAAISAPIRARWLSLDGRDRPAPALPYRPSFVHVGRGGAMTFVRAGQLWRVASPGAAPSLLGETAGLYPSVADDGTVLFVSPNGLRLLRGDGSGRALGWPIRFQVAAAPAPMIVRNVRVFDGTGAAPVGLRDLSISGGRIAAIAAPGALPRRRGVAELDAAARTAIPGLIDGHVHLQDPAVLPAALYFGVTTVRDMGGPIAPVAAARDAVMAGAIAGPRVLVSGPLFYPSPATGGWTGADEWMPADSATMVRGLELLRGFGATNVKLRYPLTFASGAMLARLARARGMSISGHCLPLSLVVAGVGELQHLDGQCVRNTPAAHDDRAQLYRAAGIAGVSTSFLHAEHARAVQDTSSAHHPDVEPFLTPQLRLMRLADNPTRIPRGRFIQTELSRRGARWFHEMGLPVVLASDAPDLPGAQHGELAELVRAGLTPAEALVAATSAAARALGVDADVGRIAVGKIADLVLLDADPLADIANTRKIWRVIQGGRVVDRDALGSAAAEGR